MAFSDERRMGGLDNLDVQVTRRSLVNLIPHIGILDSFPMENPRHNGNIKLLRPRYNPLSPTDPTLPANNLPPTRTSPTRFRHHIIIPSTNMHSLSRTTLPLTIGTSDNIILILSPRTKTMGACHAFVDCRSESFAGV